ncbi:MAG: alpha/beta hydrolase [Calditrichaeota bacterium]|nr:alpha/beta hydrolase [Calditrichota bacterium]
MIEQKTISITYNNQNFQISYFIRPGHSKTLLYLHGLGCSKDDFLSSAETGLLRSHTLVAFDFPGHGNSSYSTKLDMDDLVEITNLFIEKLNLHDIVLIGHSLGGLVALLFSDRYVEKVKAFINVEGNLKDEDCFFSRQVTEVDFETFVKKTFRTQKFRLQLSKNPGFRKCAETFGKYNAQQAIFDYSPTLVWYSDSRNLIDRFISLKLPRLFIHGSENRGLTYIPELVLKGLPVHEIPNSNHFPQYDNPSEFYTIISTFINNL